MLFSQLYLSAFVGCSPVRFFFCVPSLALLTTLFVIIFLYILHLVCCKEEGGVCLFGIGALGVFFCCSSLIYNMFSGVKHPAQDPIVCTFRARCTSIVFWWCMWYSIVRLLRTHIKSNMLLNCIYTYIHHI